MKNILGLDLCNMLKEEVTIRELINAGFGGEFGGTKIKCELTYARSTALTPTRSEIDLSQSVNFAFYFPNNIDNYFSTKKIVIPTGKGMPLVTFKGEFIIDGHHRWSQVYVFNPKAMMKTYDYTSMEINSSTMLRATQDAISAFQAENGKDEFPKSQATKGLNIFEKNISQIRKYLKAVYDGKEPCCTIDGEQKFMDDEHRENFISTLGKYVESVKDIKSALDYLCNNIDRMQAINAPKEERSGDIPNRNKMQQTDATSVDGKKTGATPNNEGAN